MSAGEIPEVSFNNGFGWYVLRVRHQNELSVSDFLGKRLNIRVKVPLQRVWKRRNGRKVVIAKPLLGTYVFIEAKRDAVEAKTMFSHKGVLGLIRNGGKPAVISDEQVYDIEKLASSEAPVYDLPYSGLVEGERVQVVAGPLAGALGQFVRISAKTGRFIVSLNLFKRTLVTELELDLVMPY